LVARVAKAAVAG
jgi:hypothetical protein